MGFFIKQSFAGTLRKVHPETLVRGLGGCAASHVEGTAEVLRLSQVFVTLSLTSFLWAAQRF